MDLGFQFFQVGLASLAAESSRFSISLQAFQSPIGRCCESGVSDGEEATVMDGGSVSAVGSGGGDAAVGVSGAK